MKKPKCTICKKEENLTIVNGKYYCKEHFEEFMNTKVTCHQCGKKVTRLDGVPLIEYSIKKTNKWFCNEKCKNKFNKEQEYKDKLNDELLKYFNYSSSKEAPTSMYVQMNHFIRKYHMTYQGMYLTLQYCISHGLKLEKGNIGLLQWKYELAKEEYIKKMEIEKSARQIDLEKTKTTYYKYISDDKNMRYKQRIEKILYLPD